MKSNTPTQQRISDYYAELLTSRQSAAEIAFMGYLGYTAETLAYNFERLYEWSVTGYISKHVSRCSGDTTFYPRVCSCSVRRLALQWSD